MSTSQNNTQLYTVQTAANPTDGGVIGRVFSKSFRFAVFHVQLIQTAASTASVTNTLLVKNGSTVLATLTIPAEAVDGTIYEARVAADATDQAAGSEVTLEQGMTGGTEVALRYSVQLTVGELHQ